MDTKINYILRTKLRTFHPVIGFASSILEPAAD